MRIIEYIKWTYNRQDIIDTALTVMALIILPGVILAFWYGEIAIAIAILTIFAIAALFVAVMMLKFLYKHWQKFNHENPPDDIRIMNKLRGHDAESNSGYY